MFFTVRASAVVAIVLFVSAQLSAQRDLRLAFETVSIKPRPADAQGPTGPEFPDRFERADTTLMLLILYAYDLSPFEIVGDPEWASSKSWQVSAKAPAPVHGEAMRMLVRRMLEDRFALKVHIERRSLPVYTLTLARRDGKLGPKIKPATLDCTPFLTGQRPMQQSPRDPASPFGLCSVGGSFTPSGLLTPRLNGRPLSGLIQHLEETLERRVVDRTGLKGNYDIELSYLDETLADKSSPVAPSQGPSLFAALRKQLGMKMESGRGPVEVLVVDSASEPTIN